MNLKHTIAEVLLQNSMLNVVVNVEHKGVHGLPENLAGSVLFKLVFETGPQIPDLELSDFGWSGTLSFSGLQYFVRVPWSACLAFIGEDAKSKYMMKFDEAEEEAEKPIPLKLKKSPFRLVKN